MIDRQRLASGLFANMGARSPRPEDVPSPMEMDSDALTADDLPGHAARATPLRALAAMGPMDAYLGSSPTPTLAKALKILLVMILIWPHRLLYGPFNTLQTMVQVLRHLASRKT